MFECQKYPYKKEFTTKAVSCDSATLVSTKIGKKELTQGFNVVLEDTILFPEGGGQPDDRGTLNGIDVLSVTRKGALAVHFITEPILPGTEVLQILEWSRRWDHMQQHSGQHLITAIADSHFGFPTSSWWLGEKVSYIELDTPSVSDAQLSELETLVNEKIRQAVPVQVEVFQTGSEELKRVRTRGLPDDHVGDVRVVTMQGIDSNMCCGTHISNLCELQMIKLLHTEKGKKGKTNLFFLCGNRLLLHFEKILERERTLTVLLKNAPEDHASLVTKLQNSLKLANKAQQTLVSELCVFLHKQIQEGPETLCHAIYRPDLDIDFTNTFLRQVTDKDRLYLIVTGDNIAVLYGPPERVLKCAPVLLETLEGKGAAKGPRFQAKIAKPNQEKINKAVALVGQTV